MAATITRSAAFFSNSAAATWLMACRLEELPGVGCFVEYEIGGHSILIVREGKDSIRAYFNACRHRGTRLARGREMLRSRLLCRGVALGTGGLALEFGQSATAALPAALVQATVRGAVLFAAGTGAAVGVTSAGALALA